MAIPTIGSGDRRLRREAYGERPNQEVSFLLADKRRANDATGIYIRPYRRGSRLVARRVGVPNCSSNA